MVTHDGKGESFLAEVAAAASLGKPEVRRVLRAGRRQRAAGRSHSVSAQWGEGLVSAWQNACLFFGLPPGRVIPALFVPTASEPPVDAILTRTEKCFLPVLVGESGILGEPSWGWGGAEVPLNQPDPRWPAQPASSMGVLDQALHEAEIVLLPALAVDEDGVRLGQGGGWYDRALAAFAEGTPVVAAVFDEEVFPGGTLPLEPHDRMVDAVITPSGFLPLPTH